jgi:hypothetical protein
MQTIYVFDDGESWSTSPPYIAKLTKDQFNQMCEDYIYPRKCDWYDDSICGEMAEITQDELNKLLKKIKDQEAIIAELKSNTPKQITRIFKIKKLTN